MKNIVRNRLLLMMLLGTLLLAACSNNNDKINNENSQTSENSEGLITTETNESSVEQPSLEYLLENDWKDKYIPELDEKYASYIEGYDGCLALVEVIEDKMLISSFSYDGDAKDNYIVREVKIAEDATYSELSIKKVITDEGDLHRYIYRAYKRGYGINHR